MSSKEYLGDSVYVEFGSGGEVILTTENGLPEDPSNTIILERYVFEALVKHMFLHSMKREGDK